MSAAEVLSSANALLVSHEALLERVRSKQRANRQALRDYTSKLTNGPPEAVDPLNVLLNLPLIQTPPRSPSASPSPPPSPNEAHELRGSSIVVRPNPRVVRPDLPQAKKARCLRYENYIPEEETIRNDYSQRYVDGGEWPQDWVVGVEMERRFEEYPKQQRLLSLKKAAVADHAVPPSYLSIPASRIALQGLKFDVILIDPPFSSSFTWEQLESLPVASLAADPSFVFLWVGSGAGEGLERGREILGKWGYRRCEDIVWIKTNKETNKGPGTDPPTTSLLTRTKQHCLMGIRGTVRRSTDSWFVHCNVDTDVIVWEGDTSDPTRKPPEMYQLIENFCLGTRRLELFGRYHSLRRGWVTATAEELNLTPEEAREKDNAAPFDRERWEAQIKESARGGKHVVPNSSEIESLRPKSPTPRGSGGGPGGGERSVSNPNMSAMHMSGSPNLPTNPLRTSSSMGATSGGVSLGTGRQESNSQISAQPMHLMNSMRMAAGNMGKMREMASGFNNPGGMGNMMGNVGMGMNNPAGMGMGGNTPGGMGGNTGHDGMMNPMGIPMNPMMGGGQGNFGYGFDGAPGSGGVVRPAAGVRNMTMTMPGMSRGMGQGVGQGMGQGMSGMNQMGQMGPANMNQMNMGMGMGGQMFGSGFDASQPFMSGGAMWNEGQPGIGGMGMGMGLNPGMGSGTGQGMGQGMRQWRGF